MNFWFLLYCAALIGAGCILYEIVLGKYRRASSPLRSAQLVAAILCLGWSVLGLWILTSDQWNFETLAGLVRIRSIMRAIFVIILLLVLASPEYRRIRRSKHDGSS